MARRGVEALGVGLGGLSAAHIGDPAVAVVPSVATGLIAGALGDFLARKLSRAERRRVDFVAAEASRRIGDALDSGAKLRADGFFDADEDGRTRAEEIAEAVLMAAQRSYEEKKLPHIGRMLAAAAFAENVDSSTLHWALGQARELTWTQYVLLGIIGSKNRRLPAGKLGSPAPSWVSWGVHQQLLNLGYGQRDLVGGVTISAVHSLPAPEMEMAKLKLGWGGTLLHDLLGLDDISDPEVAGVLAAFELAEHP